MMLGDGLKIQNELLGTLEDFKVKLGQALAHQITSTPLN